MGLDVIISVIFTLALFTFVFAKDNPVYNTAEHIFVAVGAGHAVVASYWVLRGNAWDPLVTKGNTTVLLPILLGLLLFTRYIKSISWLTRPSIALIVACGAGLGLRGSIRVDFLDQIVATFLPFNSIDNIIFVVGTVATITYFFFTGTYTRAFQGRLKVLPQVGQWFMMVAFGASFGQSVMGRLAVLVGKISFLLKDVLRIGM